MPRSSRSPIPATVAACVGSVLGGAGGEGEGAVEAGRGVEWDSGIAALTRTKGAE